MNGSIAWALKDFRVTPEWLGGAPAAWGTPPWHNKSLIEETGKPKPRLQGDEAHVAARPSRCR